MLRVFFRHALGLAVMSICDVLPEYLHGLSLGQSAAVEEIGGSGVADGRLRVNLVEHVAEEDSMVLAVEYADVQHFLVCKLDVRNDTHFFILLVDFTGEEGHIPCEFLLNCLVDFVFFLDSFLLEEWDEFRGNHHA